MCSVCTERPWVDTNSWLFILLGHSEIAVVQHPVVQPFTISWGHPLALQVHAPFKGSALFDRRIGNSGGCEIQILQETFQHPTDKHAKDTMRVGLGHVHDHVIPVQVQRDTVPKVLRQFVIQ